MLKTETIKVFIASPGDLVEERSLVDEVFAEINRYFVDSGISFRKEMWEDANYYRQGRAQEQINNHGVNNCDVFVGLLWKRWGNPTGKYSSGFEEEYKITQKRIKNKEQVTCVMYFKQVELADVLKKDRDQFKKIQKFQVSLKAFYKQFSTKDDFKKLLHDRLVGYGVEVLTKKAGVQESGECKSVCVNEVC